LSWILTLKLTSVVNNIEKFQTNSDIHASTMHRQGLHVLSTNLSLGSQRSLIHKNQVIQYLSTNHRKYKSQHSRCEVSSYRASITSLLLCTRILLKLTLWIALKTCQVKTMSFAITMYINTKILLSHPSAWQLSKGPLPHMKPASTGNSMQGKTCSSVYHISCNNLKLLISSF